MNMNVTVTYKLSPAGQRAALLAGRTATQKVTEIMSVEDPDAALLNELHIEPCGELTLDVTEYSPVSQRKPDDPHVWWQAAYLQLDTPPETLAEVIAAWRALKADADAGYRKLVAEQRAKSAAEHERIAQRQAEAYPQIEAMLAEAEAIELTAELPGDLGLTDYSGIYRGNTTMPHTPEQLARARALYKRREEAKAEAAAKARRQREAEIAATVEKYGGCRWEAIGGFTGFQGFDLWSSGQTRRWVGVFSKARGIDRFLESPRGEHSFLVKDLQVGECIQGGGFDCNSRGRRRHETEFFGVVVSVSDGLIVSICNSRAEALRESAAMARKVEA